MFSTRLVRSAGTVVGESRREVAQGSACERRGMGSLCTAFCGVRRCRGYGCPACGAGSPQRAAYDVWAAVLAGAVVVAGVVEASLVEG